MPQRLVSIVSACRIILAIFICLAALLPLSATHASGVDDAIDLRALLVSREFAQLDATLLDLNQALFNETLTERTFRRKLMPLFKAPAELEPFLTEWLSASSNPTHVLLVRGGFHFEQGWLARGGSYSNYTPQQQIARMETRFAQAQADHNAVLAKDPQCSLCYGFLISMAKGLAQSEKKVQLFQQALKQNPKAHLAVAAYYSSLQRNWGGAAGEADQFLKWMRQNYPSNPALPVIEADQLVDQVDTYVQKGDFSTPQPLVQRALTLDPEHARAWMMQSWILAQTHQIASALEATENALKYELRSPADIDWTLSQKAQMLGKLGRAQESMGELEKAADEGRPQAFRIGLRMLAGTLYKQKSDYPRLWAYCQRGMQAGLPEAFACTGSFYYFGWLKPVDYAEAFKWWKVAADRGVPESMVDIGIMYWDGQGTPHDKDQAIAYWIKGAQAGDARGVGKLQAHLTPWEFYREYTLPNFERKLMQGEAGDSPGAIFGHLMRITWDGPIGKWTITWVLPIMLGLLLLVLLLLRRERLK